MPEQELNLFQLAAADVAQLGASATQVMRGDMFQSHAVAVLVHDVPDEVLADAFAPYCPVFADRAEHPSAADLGRRGPAVELVLRPGWNRDGANMTAFANQVHDDPMSLTNLYL